MSRGLPDRKVMTFVDGTNLLCRLSNHFNEEINPHKPSCNILFLCHLLIDYAKRDLTAPELSIRDYWFSSYEGDDTIYREYRDNLRELQFEPILIKKPTKGEKGVDTSLTMEMLINAFNQNFDIGLLVAGDEDYVQLVKEVKRFGQNVYGCFLQNGLSDELKVTFDRFVSFDELNLESAWEAYQIRKDKN